jgi:glycosyltransferase involved in cell wall biosynthesis
MISTICLVMIVKNEAEVIERCLRSVRPIIQSWCIVDTGSTDGTQEKIKSILAGVPGQLVERPWVNFAHNRTESIRIAQSFGLGYALVIDADDTLEYTSEFAPMRLVADAYRLWVRHGNITHARPHIFRLDKPFRYESVIHEYLACDGVDLTSVPVLPGVTYVVIGGGDRHQDPQKYRKDAQVLKEALASEPTNARYQYYLGQSYRDAGELQKAVLAYERRARMPGWDEETWSALYEAAKLRERLQPKNEAQVRDAYLKAWEHRPERIEPLVRLSRYYRMVLDRSTMAYPYACAADGAPVPTDRLFLELSCYQWEARFERAIAAWYAGRHEESRLLHLELQRRDDLPENVRNAVNENLTHFKETP